MVHWVCGLDALQCAAQQSVGMGGKGGKGWGVQAPTLPCLQLELSMPEDHKLKPSLLASENPHSKAEGLQTYLRESVCGIYL